MGSLARRGAGVAAAACLLALLPSGGPASADRAPDFARSLTSNLGLQGRVMWVDATANLSRIKTLEGVRDIVERCRRANINVIVVDVKPISGDVTYRSKIARHLVNWRGNTYPEFDTLAAFIAEAGRAGIEVAASFNVLSEGHKMFGVGVAYAKPEWQTVAYVVDRSMVTREGARLPVRAAGEPEDVRRVLVQGDDVLVEHGGSPGERIVVALDDTRRVAGMVDPALLDGDPLAAPEDGNLLVMGGPSMEWASGNLRAGAQVRFEAVGRRVTNVHSPYERVAAFINPLHPEARAHEMSLLEEVARNYDVSALVFDRLRYADIYNDYSDLSRAAFEDWIGKRMRSWPEDVVRFDPRPGKPIRRGRYYREWLEFRARVIREFVKEATTRVRQVKPRMQFAAYVGSWYTQYYGVGVNWGSEKFRLVTAWTTPTYRDAGYAEFLDWLTTGCYYPHPTKDEAKAAGREPGASVEAAAELSTAAVANSVPVYAGLYALNYQGRADAFQRAIQVAMLRSQGVMIFDVSHIYDYNWWPALEQALARPQTAPHLFPDLLAQLRAAQDVVRPAVEARGTDTPLPAVPYQAGGG